MSCQKCESKYTYDMSCIKCRARWISGLPSSAAEQAMEKFKASSNDEELQLLAALLEGYAK